MTPTKTQIIQKFSSCLFRFEPKEVFENAMLDGMSDSCGKWDLCGIAKNSKLQIIQMEYIFLGYMRNELNIANCCASA
jgi:hypothetical protein